jgi:hypothetical protein
MAQASRIIVWCFIGFSVWGWGAGAEGKKIIPTIGQDSTRGRKWRCRFAALRDL